jgi:hypothetical protein
MRNSIWLSPVLFAGSLFGQAQSGTIVGTVTDQAGAVVPNARVTLVNEGTQFTRVTATNASGQYVAYSIPTGSYPITVEQPGFQKLVRSGIRLTAADTLTVDLQLRVGNVQETVEVTEAAPLLQSQTSTVSSLISNQQLVEMPMNGRTFTALLRLSAGAYAGSSGNLASSPYAMRGDVNISVIGSSAQNNSCLIDGMVNRNLWLSTFIMVPTIDSIQEIRLLTSDYSAEYGSAAGAVTIVQTRSGTNAFHGGLYEFLRNDKMAANTFFNNRAGARKADFRRNEFGGTFGGPIRRDKTFFFTDYQGIRTRQPRTITATVPTLAQRQMITTGDFSGLGVVIYDPANTAPYEPSVGVPLIFRVPGLTQAGAVSKTPVSQVSLFATLLDLCGLPVPSGLDGESLVPLIREPNRANHEAPIYSEFALRSPNAKYMIRQGEWKYCFYGNDTPELYNLRRDPLEMDNLAASAQYKSKAEEMKARLFAWHRPEELKA